MPRLSRIRVEGFKSIRALDLPLGALNVLIGANGSGKSNLIGANGSGKSNLIGAFRLLHEMANQRLQRYVQRAGGADALLYFGRPQTNLIRIELEFDDPATVYQCRLAPDAGGALVLAEERVTASTGPDKPPQQVFPLGTGGRESGLVAGAGPAVDALRRALAGWRVYHFLDTTEAAPIKGFCAVDDHHILRADAGNLAAVLYWLGQAKPDHYRNIVDTIRLVAPFFDDFALRPAAANPDQIRLEWRERGSEDTFNAHVLSDGTLRFMCLAALLLQPQSLLPTILLLDEPELGLHPYAMSLLADLLQEAATKTQVMISTQSVTLLNQFAPEELIVVDRDGGESVFRRLDAQELAAWLDDYTLGELWEKNIIGGRPG